MERLNDIGHQVPKASARMMACAEVMHVATGPLNRVGTGTVGGQLGTNLLQSKSFEIFGL